MARATSTALQPRAFMLAKRGLLLSLAVLMGPISGCFDASSKTSSAVFTTKSSGDPVVQATKDALKMIGYKVGEKTDTKDAREGPRTIHGERVGMVTAVGPALVHIQIVVTPLEKGSEIQVDVIPPRGAYGTTAIPLHDYHYALSQLLPDLGMKSKTIPKEWL